MPRNPDDTLTAGPAPRLPLADAAPRTAEVLLPAALPLRLTYGVPDGMDLQPGDWVDVPLGPRSITGVVWADIATAPTDFDPARLKSITHRHDAIPLPDTMRQFVDWIADYTLCEPGAVLKMVLRNPDLLIPERPRPALRYTGQPPERMTSARERVMELIADGFVWIKGDLARAAGVSTSVIGGLVSSSTLETVLVPPGPPPKPEPDHAAPTLTADQQTAAETLVAPVRTDTFAVTLLDGVTGSGKTEVYFEAIAETLRMGRQALVLLPEIALTGQFLERFEQRFGVLPAEWHSGVPSKGRNTIWRAALDGTPQVVIGARSALHLPFANLGLIVVDEEHEAAYKQEDRVSYNARDMAVVRGRLGGCPVILASATPSVESRVNADLGRYTRIALPDRFGARTLPEVAAIDLRADPPEKGRFLSPQLETAVRETLEKNQQALLFLNRRGYAPLTLCRTCGHRFQCPHCTAWLTDHRFRQRLVCHHCGHSEVKPRICPSCESEDTLVACGPGVERIAEEAAALFPEARLGILSSDIYQSTEALRAQFRAIETGEVNLVIGTQLIAKGHNFMGLTLVGVVDADMGLGFGDLRATERTFQLMSQVVGRAGRGDTPGRALIQTHMPDHPVLDAIISGDREMFYSREIAARERAGTPPFTRLAGLVVSGTDKAATSAHAQALARAAPQNLDGVSILGPAEAPLAVVRGRYRYRLLFRAARNVRVQPVLRQWIAAAPKPRGNIRVMVDVDPYSFV